MDKTETEQTVTEREKIAALRDAFVRGADWGRNYTSGGIGAAAMAAKSFYPLKVTRPRVVKDPESSSWEFRYLGGAHGMQARETKPVAGEWEYANGFGVSPLRVQCWADLIATPNETVEAE